MNYSIFIFITLLGLVGSYRDLSQQKPIKCGYCKLVRQRDGNNALKDEYPWTVLISSQSFKHLCTGSLIHLRVVLTSFSCLNGFDASELVVNAGKYDLLEVNEKFQTRLGEEIFKYPNTDIALIKLNESFSETYDGVRQLGIVCLPKKSSSRNPPTLYVTGWGKNLFEHLNTRGDVIHKTHAIRHYRLNNYLSNENCKKHLAILPPNKFCTGHSSDTCDIQSGGPVMLLENYQGSEYNVQVGFVDTALNCLNKNIGIYEDITSAREWIDEIMDKLYLPKDYILPSFARG